MTHAHEPADPSQTPSTELVRQFKDAAQARGQALRRLDAKTANAHFDTASRVWAELVRRGEGGTLLGLLGDQDDGVRLAAASKLLELAPADAERVLQELASQDTLIGMSAAATLEARRRSGRSLS